MTNPTELVGTAAACCTTLSFVPQIVHIIKTRNTDGISLKMYAVFVTGIFLWLMYGLMLNSLPIIVANAITLVLAGSILMMKIRDVVRKKSKQ
jgi:MtN3 and saliva related transmembrane protein